MRAPSAAVVAGLAFSACLHRVELPMTSGQLAGLRGSSALVAYLGQPDADAADCDGAGARFRPGDDLASILVDALRDGKVPPGTWGPCAAILLRQIPGSRAAELADRMVLLAAALVAEPRLELDAALFARLETVARVYLERDPGPTASRQAARALDAARHLPRGPDAQRAAEALAVGLELERGRWQGGNLDAAALERMASDVGAGLLLQAARRLPDPALRTQAARLLVRQRAAVSPFPEVRQGGPVLEEAILMRGVNPVSLAAHPPLRARLEPAALPARSVVVRQFPLAGRAMLLGRTGARPALSLLPAVPLRGSLHADLAGLSRPITVCAAGRAFDPTPCLAPADVSSGSPLARTREAGDLRIEEQVSAEAAVALARRGGPLRIPIAVGAMPAGALEWPISFERPPDLVLAGSGPGAAGPELAVTVERLDATRIVYRAEVAGSSLAAVVEAADAAAFRVVSRGAGGAAGAPGMDGAGGTAGLDGSSATCPGLDGQDGARGGDGSPGQDGGDGGPGGRGGDVRVRVIAPESLRSATLAVARTSVASEGGPGGPGGAGGRGGQGGPGGRGGSGATCTDSEWHTSSLRSGSSGPSGAGGSSGSPGQNGPPGRPGQVHVEAVSPASPPQIGL